MSSIKNNNNAVDKILAPGGPLSTIFEQYEFREQQAEMSRTIFASMQTDRRSLIEAGTGVGKTLAYLIPAVLMAKKDQVTVISTHTISLQSQLLEKDIPLVQSIFPDFELKAVSLKGRGNYLCKQDMDGAEADIFTSTDPTFQEIKLWSRTTKTGDVADLPFSYPFWYDIAANPDTCRQRECGYYENCFYYNAKRNAADANIIIVNHALFFSDLALRLEDPNSSILPDYHHVILDEAHHIEDVATKVFGLEMTNRRLPSLVDRIKRTKGTNLNSDRLSTIEYLNEELFAKFSEGKYEFFFSDVLDQKGQQEAELIASKLNVAMEGAVNEMLEEAKDAEGPLKDRLNGLARGLSRAREEIHTLIFRTEAEYVRWGQTIMPPPSTQFQNPANQKTRLALHHTPLEVGKILENALWANIKSIHLTSATLSNSGGFNYIKSRLHIPVGIEERILGSPFDFKSQALLFVPNELPEPPKVANENYTAKICDVIEKLVNTSNGRAFVLFTSRKMLNDTFENLKDRLDFPLFKQGDQPSGRLIESFKNSQNGCLFGTQTFWEGVDVQGDTLSCVIIDRLPFSVPDSPINKARVEAIIKAQGDWFSEFSVPQAQIKLKQGFGRLIRTKNDRGIVCILDTRLLTKNYGAEFVKHLPPASRASKWTRLEQFWNNEQKGPE